MRVSKKFKVGDSVVLLVGSKDFRGKVYTIKRISGDRVYLDGFRTMNRTQKISKENSENFKKVDASVHVSSISGYDAESSKPSRIGFQIIDGLKQRILRKTKSKF